MEQVIGKVFQARAHPKYTFTHEECNGDGYSITAVCERMDNIGYEIASIVNVGWRSPNVVDGLVQPASDARVMVIGRKFRD
jgi:hypothetical protein